jgi:hypothetical protein
VERLVAVTADDVRELWGIRRMNKTDGGFVGSLRQPVSRPSA